jgi:hypothetical protein
MKASLGDKFLVQKHLKPIYPGLGELTIPYAQPHRDKSQRTTQVKLLNLNMSDVFLRGLLHDHHASGSRSFVAGYLKEDTELRMHMRERRSTDVRANAVQVEELFFAGEFLDLIAQDQDMDTGEDRAVRHGGAPAENRGAREKRKYTAARQDEEQGFAPGGLP